MIGSLTLNSWLTTLELMPEQRLPKTYFLHEAHGNLLALGNTRQHLGTAPGGHFKQQNYKRKHKNVALDRLQK